MRYALNLAEDGRVLSVTYAKYAPADAVTVEELPNGDLYEHRYMGGEFIHDPLPEPVQPEPETENTAEEQLANLAAAIERGLTE